MKNYMYKSQQVNSSITCSAVCTVKAHLKQLSQKMPTSSFLSMQIYKSYALLETNQNMIVPFILMAIW